MTMRPSTAAMISVLDKAVTFVALILGLAILGRMLTPDDFGLFGIILAAQAIFRPIIELGLGPAYIQKPTLEEYTANVFFVLNVACGALNTAILMCLAPCFSWLYSSPRLLPLMLFLQQGYYFLQAGFQMHPEV